MTLISIALAPVLIILAYVYFRDKYEKEPLALLFRGLVAGMLITIPVIFLEKLLKSTGWGLTGLQFAAYEAFIVAAFSEEIFKFLAVFLLFWRNRAFNERFDGIVYAVFVSLGFAAIENLLYVMDSGVETGLLRAVTAVPAHAVFGIAMGYYLGLAKFMPGNRQGMLIRSIVHPLILHGIYDFLLLSGHPVLLLLFIPYVLYLWRDGARKMKLLSEKSNANE